MQISPIHVSAVVLTGGLVTGSYFFYQSVAPSKLEDHLRSLGLELAGSTHWSEKAEKYKKDQSSYPISTIADPARDTDVAEKIQKWCEKKKEKYFLGEENQDYQKFSVWCLAPKKISEVLNSRDKKTLSQKQKEAKVNEYNQLPEGEERFITPKTTKPQTEVKTIEVADLDTWCTENEKKDYEHEAIKDFKRVTNWCYS